MDYNDPRFHFNWYLKDALWFSQRMQLEGVKPNAVTLASLLASCASLPHLRLGKCRMAGLSGWTFRLQVDVNVETRLIDMYAKYNCFRLGYQVFTKTSKKRTELAREAI